MSIPQIFDLAPAYVYAGVCILGLLVGSFLNVVIYRLPKMMDRGWKAECIEFIQNNPDLGVVPSKASRSNEKFNLAVPNSTCPKCNTPIKPWHNIPVISYILLKGKCANCKTPISIRYPLVEFVSGALCVLALFLFGASWQTLFALPFIWCMISLTLIDADTHLLPDDMTLPLMWLGLIINTQNIFTDLQSAVIGAAAGYLSLWSVYQLFKLATGKEGMGYGDFKLLAALGAWMGWQYLGLIIILSSFVGAVLGIGAILIMGRDKAQPLPFGPYLCGAGLLALFWGDIILQSYLQFANPTP